jgi:hypothetical protein
MTEATPTPPRKGRSYQQKTKRSFSLRLSESARSTLVALSKAMNISQTAVLEIAIRNLAKQEIPPMKHQFATKQDALDAGYRSVVRHGQSKDKDTSGQDSFGYDFEDAEGNQTVTVWFTEELNKMGQKGSFVAMFPPKQNT